ncbi:hypothetical protein ALP64_200291 [Pseudomonas syringae pv. actinidiae]|nr:hypothetical protein ALP64_200291 [Pseudomonas syringae pv. actinidiae]
MEDFFDFFHFDDALFAFHRLLDALRRQEESGAVEQGGQALGQQGGFESTFVADAAEQLHDFLGTLFAGLGVHVADHRADGAAPRGDADVVLSAEAGFQVVRGGGADGLFDTFFVIRLGGFDDDHLAYAVHLL